MIGALLAVIAIVGGTVHPVEGEPIENGTVLIDGGRITAVGAGIPAPAGARVIDATGKVVTPGFIDPETALGLAEIWGADETVDDSGEGDPIRAAYRAIDGFNPDSLVIPVQRAHGITAVITAPASGLVTGQAALVPLWGGPPVGGVAMMVNFGGRKHGSRGEAIAELREVLDDARTYQKNKRAFERNAFRRLAAGRLDLEALQPVLRREIPLVVRADRRSDIQAALRVAEEFGLRLVVSRGAEAWKLAAELAAAKVPVIIDPMLNAPEHFDRLHARADAARVLAAAGVEVALSTFAVHDVRTLPQAAGNAVRAGLAPAAALRAVTRAPALIYGLDDRGALRVGAAADVVVWSGDPFELSTRAERVIIGGREAPRDHRQAALLERYRALPDRIRPVAEAGADAAETPAAEPAKPTADAARQSTP